MRKSFLYTLSLLVVCGAFADMPASADPVTVTGGLVTARMTSGQFTLTGDGFSLTGGVQDGFAGEIFQCEPCSGADRLPFNLSSSGGGHFSTGFPGEFDGVSYATTNLFGILNLSSPLMHSSQLLLTGATSVSAPFSLSGEILNYPPLNDGIGTPIFLAALSGSGIATAHFTRGADGLFFADDISYRFTDASVSATPEPASLLLLGTGLVGLVTRRMRFRSSR